MVDLSKEIIFRDGITLNDGVAELTEKFLSNVGHICELGQQFGLKLNKFEIVDDLVYFEWIGDKHTVLKFYTYYSKNMTFESQEKRKATQKAILAK